MSKAKVWLVPEHVAEELKLAGIRQKVVNGGEVKYLLTGGDLAAYGTERAQGEGAREISLTEAKSLISPCGESQGTVAE